MMSIFEKTGLITCMVIIIVLSFLLFFSKNGVMDYHSLKKNEAKLIQQVQVIEAQNLKLEKEINSLKTDMEYIRHLAKHEHDMVEQNELIFKDEKKGQDSGQ